VTNGQADYAMDGIPPNAWSDVTSKWGPNSPAAKAGKQQAFLNPELTLDYLAMNTTRPAFQNANVRKAVNFLIDRKFLLAQRGAFGGSVTDQILPPGMPGYKQYSIYPETPNPAMAKQLAGNPSGTITLYTCDAGACLLRAPIYKAAFQQLGFQVNVQQ